MLKKLCRGMAVAFLIVAVTGCSSVRMGDMSVISTRNVSLDKIDLDKMPQVKNVIGEDSKFIFLFIPFGIPTLEEAVDNALVKGGGDIMIDSVFYRKGWWFLVGQTTIQVKGNVIKTRGN